MAERSPIFSAKIDNQRIGYIEDAAAFDLLATSVVTTTQTPAIFSNLRAEEPLVIFLWQAISSGCRGLLTSDSRNLMLSHPH